MEQPKFSRTQDIDGNESSKRVTAFRLVNMSLVMAALYFTIDLGFAMGGKVLEFEFPYQMFWSLLGAGLLALGFTLPEWFAKK